MSEYKIRMDTYAPGLKPKKNKEDLGKLKDLYHDFEEKLKNFDDRLAELGVEKIVINIIRKGGFADDDWGNG